jgi:hypothetical protein
MNDSPDWTPDPQLLAAYFDGELECRDDLAEVRARLEAWIEAHPDACEEHHQLQKLWLDTTPREPSRAAWNRTLDQIDARRETPIVLPVRKGSWRTVGIMAASIALVFGLLFGAMRALLPTNVKSDPIAIATPVHDEGEVFPVASAEEIVIFRVEGADTGLLVVGQLPVSGPLELAAPGEIHVFHARPAEGDQMVPTVHQTGTRSAMIWAKLDTE